jgi:hypothetical protein
MNYHFSAYKKNIHLVYPKIKMDTKMRILQNFTFAFRVVPFGSCLSGRAFRVVPFGLFGAFLLCQIL